MKYTYLLALAGVAVVASTGFGQTSVAIVNPSFESGPTGQRQIPTGWTASGNYNGYSVYGDIVSDLASGISGQDGADHAEFFSWNGGAAGPIGSTATALYQDLGTTFVAGWTYTMTALGANSAGQALVSGAYFFLTDPTAGYTTGVDAITALTGTTSEMQTFTISGYTATAADNGKPIEIGVYVPAQPANGTQLVAEVDNFTLTVVPEPNSIAIAALGGFGLLGLSRRRRPSVVR